MSQLNHTPPTYAVPAVSISTAATGASSKPDERQFSVNPVQAAAVKAAVRTWVKLQ